MTLGFKAERRINTDAAVISRGRPEDEGSAGMRDGGVGGVGLKIAGERDGQMLAELQLTELNHRMANLLQEVLAAIQRQRRLQDAAAAREELVGLEMHIQATAALQRHLLEPVRHTRVDLGGLIANLAFDIEGITGLVCDVDAEWVSLPGSVATQLATGVVELAWNAYKHGYGGAAGGKVRLECRCDGDLRLRLSVTDSGLGLPPDFDLRSSTGLGLSIVRAVVDRFDGEFSVHTDRPTRFTLLLPLARLNWQRQ